MQHQGRHAVVTGGGTGIGLDIARALAAEGAQVTITGRDGARLDRIAAQTQGLFAQQMDVSDEASVRSGFALAATARGPVAICIANAGIAEPARFRDETLTHWRQTMATNLDGVFLSFQAAMSKLGKDEWGRMIAISSIAGLRGLRGAVAYTASKHGVIGLIHALSEEHLGGRVTFNALCPGYVDTDIVVRNADEIAARQGVSIDEARAYLAKGNRHRTLLETEEVTSAALWLCSDGARSVSGQSIQIAGGHVV